MTRSNETSDQVFASDVAVTEEPTTGVEAEVCSALKATVTFCQDLGKLILSGNSGEAIQAASRYF